jgi:hypothetical protein
MIWQGCAANSFVDCANASPSGTASSDIDVLLVAVDLESAELHDRLASLQADIKSWTGNELQVVEHSAASWRKLTESENPLVDHIRRDGIALMANDSSLLGSRRSAPQR